MATTNTADLQKLYVAYFNRPADFAGLAYWQGQIDAGKVTLADVAAEFSKQDEYNNEYAGLNSTQIITKIYTNLFGHGPDVPGQDYYVKLLDAKTLTLAQIVTEVAGGAQGSDKIVYNNKVIAATAFTNALTTPELQNGYTKAEANAAAKTFIAGVTTDASLSAAIAPAALAASVAAVVKAGATFTVAGGLADLDAANLALSNYIKGINLDDDTTTKGDADITAAVNKAVADIKLVVTGYETTNSAALNAALISDQQKQLNDKLALAQADKAAAVKAASAVTGLNEAITIQANTTTNLKSVQDAEVVTKTAQNVAEAGYEVQNGNTNITITATGTVTGLIKLNASGALVLEDAVTEKTNPGVTALLNSIKAEQASLKAVDAATTAKLVADADVAIRDVAPADAAALEDLYDATVTAGITPAKADVVTANEISTTILSLQAKVAGGTVGADVVLADYVKAVGDFITAAGGAKDVLASAVTTTTDAVTAATEKVADLVSAVLALNEANAYQTQLTTLQNNVKTAQDAFAAHDFAAPSTLNGVAAATSASDIFLAGTANSTVYNFNVQGKDVLYVGSTYKFNSGALTTGDNSVLEAFLIQNGANTEVHLETKAYGSASGALDQIVITLVGVNATDLSFNNGIIAHV